MQIHNFEQGTEEWLKVRLGKITATNAQALAANGKGLDSLAYVKAAEILTQKTSEGFTNPDIERGHELEMAARNSYELMTGNVVLEVGFIEHDEWVGCSPDGLIAEDGLVEIKCKDDTNFLKYLVEKEIDSKHKWQMQYQMWCTGREWVDYVVYNPNFANSTIITRVARNSVDMIKFETGLPVVIAKIKSILEAAK